MPLAREDGKGLGAPGARISTGAVQLFRKYSGRGPSEAQTELDGDMVMITLRDTLSQAERHLVASGEQEQVLRTRRAYQEEMREELVRLVEETLERKVTAFISMDELDPAMSFEIFVLDGSPLTHEDSV
jgi:uncharacterized protein YbcI